MSLLEQLADKILTRILGYESEPLLGLQLYLCGNYSFNQRLIHGGLRELRTPYVLDKLPKWPRFIPQLEQIELVSIAALETVEKPFDIAKEIRMWPGCLKELRIVLPNISQSFLMSTVTSARGRIPQVDVMDVNSTQPTIWRILEFFPQLRVLQLIDLPVEDSQGKIDRVPTLYLKGTDMSSFPATLTTLDWPIVELRKGDFSGLPRGLKTLKLAKQSSFSSLVLSSLPPGLTHLSGIQPLSDDSLSFLPRTLSEGNWIDRTHTLTIAVASALPLGIKWLNHDFKLDEKSFKLRGVDWTHTLSRSLVALTITASLTASQVATLPRSLTSLNGISIVPKSIHELTTLRGSAVASKIWPPLLTELKFVSDHPPFYDGKEILDLPHTLTLLHGVGRSNVDEDSQSIYHFTSQWPNLITDLSVNESVAPKAKDIQFKEGTTIPSGIHTLRDPNTPLGWSVVLAFPRNLTYLNIKGTSLRDDIGMTKALPPTVTTLKVGTVIYTTASALPPSITHLSIGNLVGDWDLRAFVAFPTNVTRLSLRKVTSVCPLPPEAFGSINSEITTFKIRNAQIGFNVLEFMPETITKLDLKPRMKKDHPITRADLEMVSKHWLPWIPTVYPLVDDICAACLELWPADEPLTQELEAYQERRDKAIADGDIPALEELAPPQQVPTSPMDVDPFATMDV